MFLNRVKIEWAVVFIGIIALFPFLLLCFYNHPTSDDYPFTNVAKEYGYWKAHLFWYNGATGCFLPTLQMSTNPLVWDWFGGYQIVPFIFFFIFIFAIFFLVHSITRTAATPLQKWAIVFSILFIYLYYVPRISHAFYWMTGITTYLTPTILTLIFLGVLFRIKSAPGKKYVLTALALFLLLLILNGCETYYVLIIGLVSLLAFIILVVYKRIDKLLLLLLVVVAIGSVSVLLSPGIYTRASSYPAVIGFAERLGAALTTDFIHVLRFIYGKSLLIILFSIVLFPIIDTAISKYKETYGKSLPFIPPAFAFFAVIAFPMIVAAPICWLNNGAGVVLRVSNIAFLYFVLGLLYSFFCLWIIIKKKYNINLYSTGYKRIQWILLSVVVLTLILPNNIRAAYADLYLGRAAAYNSETNKRYELIRACDTDTCIVPPINARPASLWDADLTSDPSDWLNGGYQDYFGKKAIIVPPSEENGDIKINNP